MIYSIVISDYHLNTKDGWGPFDDDTMERLKSLSVRGHSVTKLPKDSLNLAVKELHFDPIFIYIQSPRLLFISRDFKDLVNSKYAGQSEIGTVELNGYGKFKVFDVRTLERELTMQINYLKSSFALVKGTSIDSGNSLKVISEISQIENSEELESRRRRKFPLDIFVIRSAMLLRIWDFPFIVFDRTLYASKKLNLNDSGLLASEITCTLV